MVYIITQGIITFVMAISFFSILEKLGCGGLKKLKLQFATTAAHPNLINRCRLKKIQAKISNKNNKRFYS